MPTATDERIGCKQAGATAVAAISWILDFHLADVHEFDLSTRKEVTLAGLLLLRMLQPAGSSGFTRRKLVCSHVFEQ